MNFEQFNRILDLTVLSPQNLPQLIKIIAEQRLCITTCKAIAAELYKNVFKVDYGYKNASLWLISNVITIIGQPFNGLFLTKIAQLFDYVFKLHCPSSPMKQEMIKIYKSLEGHLPPAILREIEENAKTSDIAWWNTLQGNKANKSASNSPCSKKKCLAPPKLKIDKSRVSDELFQQLKKIINPFLAPTATPGAAKSSICSVNKENLENLDLSSFSMSLFGQFNERAYNILYGGQHCYTCGMRFPSAISSEFQLHEEEHKNEPQHKLVERHFASGYKNWENQGVYTDSFKKAHTKLRAEEAEAKPAVHMSEISSENVCQLCMEEINSKWDDDEDSFVLINAEKIEDQVYHESCGEQMK